MKIIHIETGHSPAKNAYPLFYTKPDTAMLRNDDPFYIPAYATEISCRPALIVRINRIVKGIAPKFAARCYGEIAAGCGFTAENLLRECREQGAPWECCKAFDKSSGLPNVFRPLEQTELPIEKQRYTLRINGQNVREFASGDLYPSVDEAISRISERITLKIGDLLFFEPAGSETAVQIGDRLEVLLNREKMMDFEIR